MSAAIRSHPDISEHAIRRVCERVIQDGTEERATEWIRAAWSAATYVRHQRGGKHAGHAVYLTADGAWILFVRMDGTEAAAILSVLPCTSAEGVPYTAEDVEAAEEALRAARQGAKVARGPAMDPNVPDASEQFVLRTIAAMKAAHVTLETSIDDASALLHLLNRARQEFDFRRKLDDARVAERSEHALKRAAWDLLLRCEQYVPPCVASEIAQMVPVGYRNKGGE